MRVLILASEFPPGPGGIGTHAYQLARHLSAAGWQIRVLSPQDYAQPDEIAAFNTRQAFSVQRMQPYPTLPIKALHRWISTLQVLLTWEPDLILASGARAVWIAAALPRRCPVAAIGHGTEFGLPGWQYALTRWGFSRANLVICVSDYARRYMLECGFKAHQIAVIPNGADETMFKPLPLESAAEFRAQHGLERARIMLTVGQVSERKGQQVMLEALPRILESCPDAHYVMAGLPTRQQALLSRARQLDVADYVHFLGRVDSGTLLKAINACDVFAMTSIRTSTGDVEGYGIAVVEAALCGKPAIVSDNSGLQEAVIDQQTGLVVAQNDPAQTAQAVIAVLTDDALRIRMGDYARQHALEHQTWTKRITEYVTTLSNLIDT